MSGRPPRLGFALPVVLAAIVLLTALVAGMLFVATEELRAGRTDIAEERSLAAAELALHQALADARLRGRSLAAIPVGGTIELTPASGTTRVRATRVSDRLLWVVARSQLDGDGSPRAVRRTVAASMRLVAPRFAPAAAITAGGAVLVTSGGTVHGGVGASVPDDSSCSAPAVTDVAGVAVPDTMRVCDGSCPTAAVPGIAGTPSRLADPAAGDSLTYERFGSAMRDRLARVADIVLDGGTYAPSPRLAGGACDHTQASNWGDPAGGASPCADYFPVVRVRGDVTLAPGSVGQGILLADGDVTFAAGARFVGVVVARDDLVMRGAGAAIDGAAFARDRDGGDGTHIDLAATVRHSACAVHRAAVAASRLERVDGHWWAELR